MEKYSDVVSIIGPPGLIPIRGASVTVWNFGTSTNASIYSSNSTSSAASNPLTTDASGRFEFYAADGRYSLQMSAASIQTTVLSDISLFDASSTAAFSNVRIGTTTTAGTIVFPARTAGRGQQIISSFDLGPFVGDPDPVIFWGYNKTQTFGTSQASEPSAGWAIEGYYNDGSGDPKLEAYFQLDGLTGQASNQFRPWFCIANRDTAFVTVQHGADLHQFLPADLTGGASVLDIYPANSPCFDFKKTVRISALAQSTGLQLADTTGTPITFTLTPNWSITGAPAWISGGAYGLSIAPGGLEGLRLPYIASSVNFIVAHGSATTGRGVLAVDGSDANIGLAVASKGTDPIDFFTNGAFVGGALSTGLIQVQILNTAGATNALQLTGSNGGAPRITSNSSTLAIVATTAVTGSVAISGPVGFYGTAVVAQQNVSTLVNTTAITSNAAFGFSTQTQAQDMFNAIRNIQQALKNLGLSA